MHSLYIAATPIGNLEDMTPRALRILREVGVVAAEDTRVARRLLSHFEIRGKRIVSYNEHNRDGRIPQLLALLEEHDVALVTDAGTPAISDPGVELVAAARAAGAQVVSVPGASAPIAALSIAGLRCDSFTFAGFLPRTAGELRRMLEAHAQRREALVVFESPQRLRRSLEGIAGALGERRLAVCRELTKLHEEVFVGSAAEALAHFEEPRGEVVIVIEGAEAAPHEHVASGAPPADVATEVRQMRALGLTRAQASALLASRHGLGRRRAYELWLQADDLTP
jgi:16S rRNA (cytidine1402-2'-O)-methyltransferase